MEGRRTFRTCVLGACWRGEVAGDGRVGAGGCPRRQFQTTAASFPGPHPLPTFKLAA